MSKLPSAIAVIGTLTRDTTVYSDGARTENLGGLHYSLLTLASLCDGQIRIVPVANVGEDAYEQIHAALDLRGLDRAQLRRVPQPNNHVFLTYTTPADRTEVLVGLVPPVTLQQCRAVLDVDWSVVNLTSGRDIELATFEALRRDYRGDIQLDVHSLTLDFEADGRRVLRLPQDWQRWVACADWVQMNEVESALLSGGQAHSEFATRLLGLGPRGVMITLGSDGCLFASRRAQRVHIHRFGVGQVPTPASPTGCGDVFGAGFAYGMLRGAQPAAACEFANIVASHKASFEPYQRLHDLRDEVAAARQSLLQDKPATGIHDAT